MTRTLIIAVVACTVSACSGGPAPASGPADQAQPAAAAPAAGAPNAASSAERDAADRAAAAPAAESPAPDAQPKSDLTHAPTATASKAPPAPEAPRAPVAPPPPAVETVTIPSGTTLAIKLLSPVGSDSSQPEDRITGELTEPVIVSGRTIVPAGAEVSGTVLSAERSGRVKGRASIALQFTRLAFKGETHRIRTATVSLEAGADTKGDVKKGGIGAGAGAIVGGIAGGGKGAAIGGIAGGTAAVLGTRGKEVRLPAGSELMTKLTDAVSVDVPVRR